MRWLRYTDRISGHNSILNRTICCAMLYSTGDDVLPWALPQPSSNGGEWEPSSKLMQAVRLLPRVSKSLTKFGPNPKNLYTEFMNLWDTVSKAFAWSILSIAPLISFFLQYAMDSITLIRTSWICLSFVKPFWARENMKLLAFLSLLLSALEITL